MHIKYFSAAWCGPCQTLKPQFINLMNDNPNITYEIIDVDNNPTETLKYKIQSVPTLLIDDNTKLIGMQGYHQLIKLIK